MNAKAVTASLKGHWYSSGYGMVRCVAHEDDRPSLRLRDGEHGLLVKCLAGCRPEDVLRRLRVLGLGDDGGRDRGPAVEEYERRRQEAKDRERREAALALWHGSRPAAGTPVETYLRSRAITLSLPASIRYLPDAKHGPTGLVFPTMVAAIAGLDRRITAVHRTFLRVGGGGKAGVSEPKMALGHIGRGCVRLAAAGVELGVAEGIETGLSAQQLFGIPVWCACGSWLEKVALPDSVSRMVIFADNGPAGEQAAEKAARAHVGAGRAVDVRFPSVGDDWNDALRASAAGHAA